MIISKNIIESFIQGQPYVLLYFSAMISSILRLEGPGTTHAHLITVAAGWTFIK
uniref:Uncharacterized protein n=1 Tax=Spironucleus salmonicida TaxID=348837 RepID=V6LJD7_9EUKA|eukprot:EST44690.1 Hypothetical protein SS50377_15401 [Spironucleus salmonicida]